MPRPSWNPEFSRSGSASALFGASSLKHLSWAGWPVVLIAIQQLSYGYEGIWPEEFEPDYRGIDDVAEIWWDTSVVGLDEIDKEGTGIWRFVNGGLRYKPGEIPDGPPDAFVVDGTTTIYEERPADEAFPGNYEPLPPR